MTQSTAEGFKQTETPRELEAGSFGLLSAN
jgi:hypothetical protein